PEFSGSRENGSSIFYIAKNAKNTEGAWEFMKFMYSSEELAKFMSGMGNIPSRVTAMDSPLFADVADSATFIEFSKNKNIKSLPNIQPLADILNKVIKEEFEAMYNLRQTPEETLKKMQSRTEDLLK
ncbi:MAG: extracellular solute-binding protein, partial [Gorillibacterium sp.]|nr:extracellular solute-binding protein [Gorillibacterium sp.]